MLMYFPKRIKHFFSFLFHHIQMLLVKILQFFFYDLEKELISKLTIFMKRLDIYLMSNFWLKTFVLKYQLIHKVMQRERRIYKKFMLCRHHRFYKYVQPFRELRSSSYPNSSNSNTSDNQNLKCCLFSRLKQQSEIPKVNTFVSATKHILLYCKQVKISPC